MEEQSVREHAQGHADAVVAGDLRRAAGDLTREAQASAQEVMSKLPRVIAGAEILKVDAAGDEYVAHIAYRGDDAETVVESRWVEREGRPRIVRLSVA